MKAEVGINQQLNAVLQETLTAINQYFLHARMLGNWGLKGLERQEYHASIEAMKISDRLVNRVLFLQGLPNLQDLGKLLIGENVTEMLNNDLVMETRIRQVLVQAIGHCEHSRDYQSREHLEDILKQVEARIDWSETQLWLINNSGLQNYLQTAMSDEE